MRLTITAHGSHPLLSTTFHLDTLSTTTIREVRQAIGLQLQALHNGSAPPSGFLFGDLLRGDVHLVELDTTLLQYGIVGGSVIRTEVRGFRRGLGHCDGGKEAEAEWEGVGLWGMIIGD